MAKGKPVIASGSLGHRRSRVRVLSHHDETDLQRRVWKLEEELKAAQSAETELRAFQDMKKKVSELAAEVAVLGKQLRARESQLANAQEELDRIRPLARPVAAFRHELNGLDDVLAIAMHHASQLPKAIPGTEKLYAALVRLRSGLGRALEGPRKKVMCPIHDAKLQGENAKCYCKDKPEWQRVEEKKAKLVDLWERWNRAKGAAGLTVEEEEDDF
jgi:hypothetical protein